MSDQISLGKLTDSRGSATIDLASLIRTRLLIQANSGAGKSRTIRRLLEQSHGQVQQIVLDIEGDFSTLREKYDYILAGKGGDIELNLKVAELLARRLLELGVSAIVDLYELKSHERVLFVKRFLDAMMNAPKSLWHPCMVVVDEAHVLCPEKGQAESMGSIIDLCTRGRKRGYCAVLATQRLSKLSKDAAAELLNKLIGRTGLDVDVKRAADELGFTSKDQNLSLRSLKPGGFYAFGPAISDSVVQLQVGDVATSHPEAGARGSFTAPPPTKNVLQLLAKLNDLPQEAEEELNTVADLKKKVRELQRGLRSKPKPEVDEAALQKAEQRGHDAGRREAQKQVAALCRDADLKAAALKQIQELTAKALREHHQGPKPLPAERSSLAAPKAETAIPRSPGPTRTREVDAVPNPPKGGAMRMLRAAVMYQPEPISRMRMATLSGMSHKSGTFGTYLGSLRSGGWIEDDGDKTVPRH